MTTFVNKIFWFDLTIQPQSQSKMSGIRKIPQQGGAANSIDTSFQVLTFWPRIFLRFKVKIYVEINARVMVTRTEIETS